MSKELKTGWFAEFNTKGELVTVTGQYSESENRVSLTKDSSAAIRICGYKQYHVKSLGFAPNTFRETQEDAIRGVAEILSEGIERLENRVETLNALRDTANLALDATTAEVILQE